MDMGLASRLSRDTVHGAFQEAKNEIRGSAFGGELDFVNALALCNEPCAGLEWQEGTQLCRLPHLCRGCGSESAHLFLWHAMLRVSSTFDDDKAFAAFLDALGVDLPAGAACAWDDLLALDPPGPMRGDLADEVLCDLFVRAPWHWLRHAVLAKNPREARSIWRLFSHGRPYS